MPLYECSGKFSQELSLICLSQSVRRGNILSGCDNNYRIGANFSDVDSKTFVEKFNRIDTPDFDGTQNIEESINELTYI